MAKPPCTDDAPPPGLRFIALGTQRRSRFTRPFKKQRKVFGHLFSGRYKALIVEGSGNGYLKTVCDYVHLNPVRAGLLRGEEPLERYAWSSYPLYLSEGPRPLWLRVDRLLGEWRVNWDQPGASRQFAALMEVRRQGELDQEFKPLGRGWCLTRAALSTSRRAKANSYQLL